MMSEERSPKPLTYRDAGVHIDASHEALARSRQAVEAARTPAVLHRAGAFAGAFDAAALAGLAAPVLLATTDGVGTKAHLAARLGRLEGLGADLVHHGVNDLLAQGAEPLFFLDYIASGRLDPAATAALITSVADACRGVGIPLLGGELAELPGVYQAGALELVGTCVGAASRGDLLDGARVQAGDVILGLPSSGLHTNGYALATRALAGLDWSAPHPALGASPEDVLLAPHRCYLAEVRALRAGGVDLRAAAHITGGGLRDNPDRLLPPHLTARLDRSAWTPPPIFELIAALGPVAPEELERTFNLGLGFLLVVPPEDAARACGLLPPGVARVVGEIAPRGAP